MSTPFSDEFTTKITYGQVFQKQPIIRNIAFIKVYPTSPNNIGQVASNILKRMM